jgi:hypothetical protein
VARAVSEICGRLYPRTHEKIEDRVVSDALEHPGAEFVQGEESFRPLIVDGS